MLNIRLPINIKVKYLEIVMQENKPFHVCDGAIQGNIIANKEFFERDAVLAVASKYSEEFYVSVTPHDETHVSITLRRKNKSTIIENDLAQFMNELIDQQVRVDLQKEYGDIRKAIVSHAFSAVER